jgi:hypothetical protein
VIGSFLLFKWIQMWKIVYLSALDRICVCSVWLKLLSGGESAEEGSESLFIIYQQHQQSLDVRDISPSTVHLKMLGTAQSVHRPLASHPAESMSKMTVIT